MVATVSPIAWLVLINTEIKKKDSEKQADSAR